MGPGSDSRRVFVVRVLLSRPDLRLCAARLRCLACVDGPVLDRVHVFLHVRPRFVVQFVHQSCCACCGNAGGCPHGRYNRFMEQKHPRVVILTLVPNLMIRIVH